MDSRTWEQAIELARQKARAAASKAASRNCHGEIVARIRFGPKGPGKVRAEIVETFPED